MRCISEYQTWVRCQDEQARGEGSTTVEVRGIKDHAWRVGDPAKAETTLGRKTGRQPLHSIFINSIYKYILHP